MDARARVLILDDETIVVERLKASLERAGFAVAALSSSKSALRRLREEEFDILVTDIKMASPDGMEVLRFAHKVRPQIKSVVITGFATKATAEEARQNGAVAFIAKPFKISQLRSLLMSLVE